MSILIYLSLCFDLMMTKLEQRLLPTQDAAVRDFEEFVANGYQNRL
jgi:hypothetical protein